MADFLGVYIATGFDVIISLTSKIKPWMANQMQQVTLVVHREPEAKRPRVTTEDFIAKARARYGDKYDYSKVIYVHSKEDVIIICRTHGDYKRTPNAHLRGQECLKCKKLEPHREPCRTFEEFLRRTQEVHGKRYDYTETVFETMGKKSCIICRIHGKFWQSLGSHIKGQGCPDCGHQQAAFKQRCTTEQFIQKSRAVHGDKYNYDKVVYTKSDKYVCITCLIHGDFQQIPDNHLYGFGCKGCANDSTADKIRSTCEEFIEQARRIHGNRYNYDKVIYVAAIVNVIIHCIKHMFDFEQTPHSHLRGSGCPKCKFSHGERIVDMTLTFWKIPFGVQYKLAGNRKYPYDFAMTRCYNFLIEYDGQQHFSECPRFHVRPDAFKKQQERDVIKTLNAINAGCCLIRIDYSEKDRIAQHLHTALTQPQRLYLSSMTVYTHITESSQIKPVLEQLMAKLPMPN